MPDAPTSKEITISSSKIKLSWVAGADNGAAIEFYQVAKLNDAGDDWEVYKDNLQDTNIILGSGLVEGQQYKFKVRAKNSAGYSAYSEDKEATITYVPSQPKDLVKDAATISI